MQRPYEILEFQPYDEGGNALGADVDLSSVEGLQWRESSRGLILPGKAWQDSALDLARIDAPVHEKDSRGRPIPWLAPHNHMLPALQGTPCGPRTTEETAAAGERRKRLQTAGGGKEDLSDNYDQWCVLDDGGVRQKRKTDDERWKTTQLVKEAPVLILPKKLNGKGLVHVVQKWHAAAGFKSLSSLHSGSGRQIIAEALASCTAPSSRGRRRSRRSASSTRATPRGRRRSCAATARTTSAR